MIQLYIWYFANFQIVFVHYSVLESVVQTCRGTVLTSNTAVLSSKPCGIRLSTWKAGNIQKVFLCQWKAKWFGIHYCWFQLSLCSVSGSQLRTCSLCPCGDQGKLLLLFLLFYFIWNPIWLPNSLLIVDLVWHFSMYRQQTIIWC